MPEPASTEALVPVERVQEDLQLVNPATGEVVLLNAPTNEIAAAVDATRELEGRLREFKGRLNAELLDRMDKAATWTARGGGYKVSGDGPRQPNYDGPKLAAALRPLVEAGVIEKAAMLKAVEPAVEWKAKKAGINALLKLGEKVVAAVKSAEVENTKPRQVRVSPERPA